MALPAQSLLQSAPAALVKADRSEPPIQHLPILQSGLVILFRSAMDIPISTAILLPANSAARTLSRPQHARNPSSCEQRPGRRRRWKAWLDRRSALLVRAADTRNTAIRPPWPGRNAAAGSVHSGIPDTPSLVFCERKLAHVSTVIHASLARVCDSSAPLGFVVASTNSYDPTDGAAVGPEGFDD